MNTSLEQVRDRLRREVERIERDRMKYDECAYRTPSATLDDLADAIDAHLSRAAEPVYQVTGLAGGDWMDCDRATYDEAATWAHGEDRRRILHTHPPEPARDACTWVEDSDYGTWDTKCGNRFVLNEGTPAENHMHHCCYCGHELEEIPYSEDAAMAQESGDE